MSPEDFEFVDFREEPEEVKYFILVNVRFGEMSEREKENFLSEIEINLSESIYITKPRLNASAITVLAKRIED